jgi:predicted nucleic acid-binding protein
VIQLDTCYLIRALIPGTEQDRRLRAWLRAGESIGLSAVAWAEFQCGPVDSREADLAGSILAERVPLDEELARQAATLFSATGRRSGSLLDCMIAATAISRDADLATANPADFRRFEKHGLRLAD